MTPQERIEAGAGVVGVLCACCHETVIVVNSREFQFELRDLGACYRICRKCQDRTDIEKLLTANGNGTEELWEVHHGQNFANYQ